MGWFDSFFSGLSDLFGSSNPSVADAAMGGTTDLGALAASTPDFAANAGDWIGSAASGLANVGGGDWGFGGFGGSGAGIDTVNPAMFDGGLSGTPVFDPSSVGPPPVGNALPPVDTLGSVVPNQGSSVAGSFANGGGSFGDSVDPEQFARQGQMTNLGGGSTGSPVDSFVQPQPPPTAWESTQQAPGKWWQGVSDQFNQNPIGNSLKIGTGLASIGVPLAAAAMVPSAPKIPRQAGQAAPAALVAPKPLPGTTGTSRSDIPAASALSPLLGRSGGFKVGSNQGLSKKKPGAR